MRLGWRTVIGSVACLGISSCLLAATTTVLPDKTLKILPTKDVTMVSWINGSVIDLPTQLDGVDNELMQSLNAGGSCSILLGQWLLGIPTYLDKEANKLYANAFLIKFSANNEPPPVIDPDAVELAGDYRLFNRLQIAHRVKNGEVIGAPKFTKAKTLAGLTPDPCGAVSPRLPETHVANGAKGITTDKSGVYQVAQGRVGAFGQAVDTTINDYGGTVGATTPWIWTVIKFDVAGNYVFPFAVGNKPNISMFPTVSIYENGQRIRVEPAGGLAPFMAQDESYQIPGQVP